MIEAGPVERVARALEMASFRRLARPLQIAGLTFDVPAVLVGAPPSPDLVLIGDTIVQTVRDLQKTVEGVARALDVMRSRRPLTLVLVGPRLESKAISALSRYARVLPVGVSADDASLANWLAVLLPLRLPQPVESRGMDCLEELRSVADPLALQLIEQALSGTDAVAEHLVEMVEAPFLDTGGESEESEA